MYKVWYINKYSGAIKIETKEALGSGYLYVIMKLRGKEDCGLRFQKAGNHWHGDAKENVNIPPGASIHLNTCQTV